MTGIPAAASVFYRDLEQDRAWWAANRDRYRSDVEAPLRALLEEGAERFGGPVKLFRPHRDMRFSHDKSPLRAEALGGLGAPPDVAARWVRVDRTGVRIGGGAPRPSPAQLRALRERIAADPHAGSTARGVLATLHPNGYATPDDPLKTAPRGSARDHPDLDLLCRRAWMAERDFAPGELAGAEGRKQVFAVWRELEPLIAFLRASV